MCNKIVRIKGFYHIPTPQMNYNYGMKGASLGNTKLKLNPTPYLDPILEHNRKAKEQLQALKGLYRMTSFSIGNQNQSLKGASLGIRSNNKEGINALKNLAKMIRN